MLVSYSVKFPIANPLKCTYDGENSNQRARFDQKRYAQSKNATTEQKKYQQLWESADLIRQQVYTNYPLRRARVVDCDGAQYGAAVPLTLLRSYRDKVYRIDCMFTSLNGKLFAYFIEGFEYSDDAFEYPGDLVTLSGRLPNINAAVGDLVGYRFGTTGDLSSALITAISWNPAILPSGAQGYLLDVDSDLVTPVSGQIEINYDEKDVDLYVAEIDVSALDEGEYFVRFEFGVNGYDKVFTSEPLDLREEHEGSLAVECRHEGTYDEADQWKYIYEAGWYNILRVPADFYQFAVGGEVSVDMNDTGEARILRSVPYLQLQFAARNIPSWMVRKFTIMFSHDVKRINGEFWEIENLGEFQAINRMDLGTFEITLKLKGDNTIAEWDFEEDLEAYFDPEAFAALAFAGAVVVATFHSSIPGLFRFINLPAWITTDVEEFSDGQDVEFTIAANATAFPRNITLIAQADDVPDLTADVSIAQLYDDSAPEYIDTNLDEFTLTGAAGSNQDVIVSASSAWEAIIQSGHAFTLDADGVSPIGALNVSEPTQNSTAADRVGVVRVRLISNPTVFKDINVTQAQYFGMILLTPGLIEVSGPIDHDVTTDVSTYANPSWQAVTVADWIHFDTSIHVGNAIGFAIHVDAKPPYVAPRSATVTFYNIANVSDSLTLTINQTD